LTEDSAKRNSVPTSELVNSPFGINRTAFFKDKDVRLIKEDVEKLLLTGEVFSGMLSSYFSGHLNRPDLTMNWIFKRFKEIRYSKRSRIKSKNRSRLHYVFDKFSSSNILNTKLAIDLHYHESLKNPDVNNLWIVAEHGVQLAKFLQRIAQKGDQIHIKLILANYHKEAKDFPDYDKIIRKLENMRPTEPNSDKIPLKRILKANQIKLLDAKDHNHHMALFLSLEGDGLNDTKEHRGIYYYQKGLNQDISPIRLFEKENIEFLKDKFDAYWKESHDIKTGNT